MEIFNVNSRGADFAALGSNNDFCLIIDGLNELLQLKRSASVMAAPTGLVDADFGIPKIEQLIQVLEANVETSSVLRIPVLSFEQLRGGPENVMLYFHAYSTDEHDDGPTFAALEVPGPFFESQFWRKLVCLRNTLVNTPLGLNQLNVYDGPDYWNSVEFGEDQKLCVAELVMTQHGFWFSDRPKHAEKPWETEQVSLEWLAKAVLDASSGKVFVSDEFSESDLAEFEAEAIEQSEASHG
jgi:hypothetical protein